ncbi:hypothetical protein [Streptomyces sp. SPB074]|uniref:hypothetical protein n=1 Tax=Streptomyces sp. (strain SPB074) TaxID=465543 RepID=UPI00017F1245|nr:hypothetical protein [Streptomyces sp. SPB074]EDY43995.1 hypothetical protein SSBG_02185 [Streptomyces sp. SPB074]
MKVEVSIGPRFAERLLGGVGEQTLRRRAERVADLARAYAPGSMARGITMRVEGRGRGMEAIITSTHPASRYVLHGTAPHIIRPRRARALRFQAGGRTVFAAVVHHPGTRANDFLSRALREGL